MTTAAVNAWLPRNAIAAAAEQLAVREMVADWAATWFARGGAVLRGMDAIAAGQRLSGAEQAVEDGLGIAVDADATAAIAALMVGSIDATATAADHAAIDAAVVQAIGDLRGRAARLLGLSADVAWRPRADGERSSAGYRFRIALGAATLSIVVADRLLIAAIKGRLRPAASRPPLDAPDAGLAAQAVTISALLGTARLAMGELAALSVGDVVILDRQLTDPALLAVDGDVRQAPCRVSTGGAHLALAFV